MYLKHIVMLLLALYVVLFFQTDVYEAVITWVRSNVEENCKHLAMLISRLRLSQLPVAYLLEKVCKEQLLREDTVCRDYIDEAKDFQMSRAAIAPSVPLTERILPRKSYAGWFKFYTCRTLVTDYEF